MAENKLTTNNLLVEKLPYDVLKDIMLRVAKAPDADYDILNSFLICKSFHQDFSHNKEILQVVAFEDISKYCSYLCKSVYWDDESCTPNLDCQFEAFSYMGGFIVRAARAGNTKAELILAKLLIRCSSELYRAANEAKNTMQPTLDGDEKLRRCVKASSFLAHFTRPQDELGTFHPKLVHFELIRKLLMLSSVEELQAMKTYFQDYASYFQDLSVKVDHNENFNNLLDHLDKIDPAIVLPEMANLFVKAFNNLCLWGCKTMHILELRELMLPEIKEYDYFNHDTLIDHFYKVEELLLEGFKGAVAGELDFQNVSISKITERISGAKKCLLSHLKMKLYIHNIKEGIIDEFDTMFPILNSFNLQ